MATFNTSSVLLLLLLHFHRAAESIPFSGTIRSSSSANKHSYVDDHYPPPTQRDRQRRDVVPSSSSWLEGFEPEQYDNNQHYDEDFSSQVLESLQSHPLLQIPCRMTLRIDGSSYNLPSATNRPIRCFCDTGAQKTVMSSQAAQAAGLIAHLDRRYADTQAVGVGGSGRVLGRVPPGVATLKLYGDVDVPSPAIIVLEDLCGVDLLLGLDFLREHDAVLDLRHEELTLTVSGRTIHVPFLKPRTLASQPDQPYLDDQRMRQSFNKENNWAEDLDGSDCYDYDEEEEGGTTFRGQIDMSGI